MFVECVIFFIVYLFISFLFKFIKQKLKILNKTKKLKDIESLIRENEALQAKIYSHEEDFRLQNSTMMQEIASLIKQNELNEIELNKLRSTANTAASATASATATATTVTTIKTNESTFKISNEELINLKAENSALKNLLNSINQSNLP